MLRQHKNNLSCLVNSNLISCLSFFFFEVGYFAYEASPNLFPSNHDTSLVFREGLDFPLWGERVAPSGSNLLLDCQIEGENLFKRCLNALLKILSFLN